MKSSDFLDFATSICVNALPKPACAANRSATSRAYYAAFHTAKEFLVATNPDHAKKRRAVHDWFLSCLSMSKDKELLTVTAQLKDLKVRREMSDYDFDVSDCDDIIWTRDSIEIATSIINELIKVKGDGVRFATVGNLITENLKKTNQYNDIYK